MKRYFLVPLILIVGLGLIFTGCAAPIPTPAPAPAPAPAPSASPAPAPSAAPAPAAKPAAPVPAAKQKTWTLKLSHNQTTTNYMNVYGHIPWANEVEKATNGIVKVEIYPLSSLMQEKGSWEGIKSGIADLTWFSSSKWTGQFDLLNATALPFMMPLKADNSSKVAWSLFQKFPEIQKQFADVKVLTVYTTSPYFFVTAKKQIKTLEDFKGVKIRVSNTEAINMLKALGAVPVTLLVQDSYQNLQKGVLDGDTLPAEAYIGFRLYEVAPNLTMVSTSCNPQEILMNKDKWNEMPADIQQVLTNLSGEKQSIRYGAAMDKSQDELPDLVAKAGYKLNIINPEKPEMDKWAAVAGKPVWDDWVKRMGAVPGAKPQEILDETIRLSKEYNK